MNEQLVIRAATLGDVPFMDRLQKKHSKELGFFPVKQFEGYVREHLALVAWEGEAPVGYILARDRYSGRDDVGAIYQLAVVPGRRRLLVGAALVRGAFERVAYGCRLMCCWCAQDLAANRFWEACGFVPVAFRTGSRTKGKRKEPRIHILWQRRVVAGDDHPWWMPFQTRGGAVREERLVFPIAPGVRWDDVMPAVLPESCQRPAELIEAEAAEARMLADQRKEAVREKRAAKKQAPPPAAMMTILVGGRPKLVPKPAVGGARPPAPTPIPEPPAPKPRKAKPMLKHEKAAVVFCRELRDRWLERVAAEPALLEAASPRHEVGRLPGGTEVRALPEAA